MGTKPSRQPCIPTLIDVSRDTTSSSSSRTPGVAIGPEVGPAGLGPVPGTGQAERGERAAMVTVLVKVMNAATDSNLMGGRNKAEPDRGILKTRSASAVPAV